jgi:hypothetical protein
MIQKLDIMLHFSDKTAIWGVKRSNGWFFANESGRNYPIDFLAKLTREMVK